MTEKELLEAKKKIDVAKNETSKLKGSLEYLMKDLGSQFKCKTHEEAEIKIKDIENQMKQIDKKILENTEKIENIIKQNNIIL